MQHQHRHFGSRLEAGWRELWLWFGQADSDAACPLCESAFLTHPNCKSPITSLFDLFISFLKNVWPHDTTATCRNLLDEMGKPWKSPELTKAHNSALSRIRKGSINSEAVCTAKAMCQSFKHFEGCRSRAKLWGGLIYIYIYIYNILRRGRCRRTMASQTFADP